MRNKTKNLLQDAGRGFEVFIGGLCAVSSLTFAALFVWFAYLVVWRNPREFGVNDLFKLSTLLIFLALLGLAIGFSVLATRLVIGKAKNSILMSPMLLRIWGTFFCVGSVTVLIDAIAKRKWMEAIHFWTIFTGALSMAVAAFILARIQERASFSQKNASKNNADGTPFKE